MQRQEMLGAQWSVKAWLKANKVSAKRASEVAGVSDTIIHVWDAAGRTPFSFWKLCHVQFRVADKLGPLPKLVRPSQPYRVTEAMWHAAIQFDQQYQGTKFFTEPGGTVHEIVAPSPDAITAAYEASQPAPPAPPPVSVSDAVLLQEMLAKLPKAGPFPKGAEEAVDEDELDVLLTLLVRLKTERDTLKHQNFSLTSQLQHTESDRVELERLRTEVAKLQREVEQFRNLADAATSPGGEPMLMLRSKPGAVDKIAGVIGRRAPQLLEELRRLPLQA